MVTFLTPLALNSREISKGSLGRAFAVRSRTGKPDQANICLYALREVSVHAELAFGQLRYRFAGVPPQSNSPPNTVLGTVRTKHVTADHRGSMEQRLALNQQRYDAQPNNGYHRQRARNPKPRHTAKNGQTHSTV